LLLRMRATFGLRLVADVRSRRSFRGFPGLTFDAADFSSGAVHPFMPHMGLGLRSSAPLTLASSAGCGAGTPDLASFPRRLAEILTVPMGVEPPCAPQPHRRRMNRSEPVQTRSLDGLESCSNG